MQKDLLTFLGKKTTSKCDLITFFDKKPKKISKKNANNIKENKTINSFFKSQNNKSSIKDNIQNKNIPIKDNIQNSIQKIENKNQIISLSKISKKFTVQFQKCSYILLTKKTNKIIVNFIDKIGIYNSKNFIEESSIKKNKKEIEHTLSNQSNENVLNCIPLFELNNGRIVSINNINKILTVYNIEKKQIETGIIIEIPFIKGFQIENNMLIFLGINNNSNIIKIYDDEYEKKYSIENNSKNGNISMTKINDIIGINNNIIVSSEYIYNENEAYKNINLIFYLIEPKQITKINSINNINCLNFVNLIYNTNRLFIVGLSKVYIIYCPETKYDYSIIKTIDIGKMNILQLCPLNNNYFIIQHNTGCLLLFNNNYLRVGQKNINIEELGYMFQINENMIGIFYNYCLNIYNC